MKNKVLKNYIILFIIVIITFVISLYILSWYKQYKDRNLSIPVISNTLREIKYDDIKAVTTEREFLFIYTCTSSEDKCREFEEQFSKYIKQNDYTDYMVYINLGYDSDETSLLSRIYNTYKYESLRKKVNNYPTIFVFSDGKIVDLLSFSDNNKPSIKKVKNFMAGYDLND